MNRETEISGDYNELMTLMRLGLTLQTLNINRISLRMTQ